MSTLSNGLWEEEKAVSMSMFYHIPQEGEYRFVQCSNASDAILSMTNRGTMPFLSAGSASQFRSRGSVFLRNPCALNT
ncbi:hypothetical protein CO657_19935 [Rhizobium acidisoli]|uniref:Uncharacterized protein n=1 Tax=Rhizobium acidisoli TaxID=1538158 RepID=A0AAE5TYE7_9HYPH|nr:MULTISPECIES: hypothetical protein [Rhizobium]QAS80202.1 hypothetical protein CO657_19935 [Rhizobium acidisoli]